ncbi:MAG: CbtB domain-containing protein [Dongiaceae bacterium]
MQTPTGLHPETVAVAGSRQRADTLIGVALAALLGAFIVFMVGFSHIDAFHNAAHDTRHSNGFPCH